MSSTLSKQKSPSKASIQEVNDRLNQESNPVLEALNPFLEVFSVHQRQKLNYHQNYRRFSQFNSQSSRLTQDGEKTYHHLKHPEDHNIDKLVSEKPARAKKQRGKSTAA